MTFSVTALGNDFDEEIKQAINEKTKPPGSLGQLEEVAFQLCRIQKTLKPELLNPHIIVFAADHGLAQEGVSPYPQEVTYQMVLNFIHGGAAINAFCKANRIDLKVVDAGVIGSFAEKEVIKEYKINEGTANCLKGSAMSAAQLDEALANGAKVVEKTFAAGCNVIGFGEMGIGNTSAASLIMHALCQFPLEDCVGRGTGSSDKQLAQKLAILSKVANSHKLQGLGAKEVLQKVGGFEIAMMTAAFLKAAELKMTILVDGFIATAAFLCAYELQPNVKDYAIFCHCSNEKGHEAMLAHLQAKPLLNLGLRLGEGSGCAVGYSLVASSAAFMTHMASFTDAGVSQS